MQNQIFDHENGSMITKRIFVFENLEQICFLLKFVDFISVCMQLKKRNGCEPLPLIFGLSQSMRLAGLRLDVVFALFDGLDAEPDVLLSVLSVLDELCELIVDAVQVANAT